MPSDLGTMLSALATAGWLITMTYDRGRLWYRVDLDGPTGQQVTGLDRFSFASALDDAWPLAAPSLTLSESGTVKIPDINSQTRNITARPSCEG